MHTIYSSFYFTAEDVKAQKCKIEVQVCVVHEWLAETGVKMPALCDRKTELSLHP